LGAPASLQILVEVGVFATASALAGKLDAASLAAHQVTLTAASFSFMVPFGLGAAGAVRVGQAIGRGDPQAASRAGWTAIILGVSVMACFSLVFLSAPQLVARLFTEDVSVISAAPPLLALAALFQIFDGAQGVATGALRGAGSTRTAAFTHLIVFWVFGLPLGAALCFWTGWGAFGLWTGLTFGLVVIGVILTAAWARLAARPPTESRP
jgi:MATE family multidrug resistance protein